MMKLKIQDLKVSESLFIQLNTIKGFTYLDNVGEIINSFYKGSNPPLMQLSPNQLIILEPCEGISQMRVDLTSIFANIIYTGDIRVQLDFYQQKVAYIAKLLGRVIN